MELLEHLRETYEAATLVIIGAAVVGVIFGILAEYSRYCLRAAVAEHVGLGGHSYSTSPTPQTSPAPRTQQVLLAILTALIGTQLLHASGLIELGAAIHWSVSIKPLALIVGGGLFGVGMVLAGGCVSRLLVLAASGNARSWVTLLIIGLSGYATLRGLLSYPRIWLESAWDTQVSAADLLVSGNLLPVSVGFIAILVAACLLVQFARTGFSLRSSVVVPGIGIGLTIVAAWFVTGVVGADDFDPIPLTALSFVAPVGETVQYFMIFTGDTIRFSIALVFGVLAGASASAMFGGRFAFAGFQDEKSVLRYIAGGVLMGFGGVTALGCTVGQGLSGLSTASPASLIAVSSIVLAAYFTMKFQAQKSQQQPHPVTNATQIVPAE